MNDAYLTGKHAIVTGGGRGIGGAISTELASLGADLTLMGRNDETLWAHAEKLKDKFAVTVEAVSCDIGDQSSIVDAFIRARRKFGAAYVLVNNAGCADACAFTELSRDAWDWMLAVNLTGTFLCAKQVLPAMLENRAGRIVNIASTAGLRGYRQLSAYCASKHGVVGLTRALALEVAKHGITVNAVCPTYTLETGVGELAIDNIMNKLKMQRTEAVNTLTRTIPRGSLVTTAEVANAVAWLCSPGASAITGQSIAVAAGEVM